MKVLAISHSCIVDVNQQLFVELNQICGTEIELIIPSRWRSEYSNGAILAPSILPSVDFTIHQLPVANPGHVSLHFYTRLERRRLQQFGPDVILSAQEPWSLSGLQAALLARRLQIPF